MSANRLQRIEQTLRQALDPEHLEVLDESHQHSGNGQHTHLRLVIVARQFKTMSRVARQQKVYSLVDQELKSGLHALAMRTFTPEEWALEGSIDRSQSPPCMGADED